MIKGDRLIKHQNVRALLRKGNDDCWSFKYYIEGRCFTGGNSSGFPTLELAIKWTKKAIDESLEIIGENNHE